jgi:glycosyltransferase involved in cell wall biosynthesis
VKLQSSAARLPLAPVDDSDHSVSGKAPLGEVVHLSRPLTVLVVAPTLHAGAADAGAIDLVRILSAGGHRPILVSRGGRRESEATAAGATLIRLDVATQNPFVMARNAVMLARLVRKHGCDVAHAHGRAAAWSTYLAARAAGVPFLTTWYKGFRQQNALKRLYNGVMARGERVIAVSDQIAELIAERHGTPPARIAVIPTGIDLAHFDPAAVSQLRVESVKRSWGISGSTRVILVVGRMLRRKGHHVVVKAVHRLKERGLKDVVCVIAGEDQGQTRYSGELWDLVASTGTADVIRLAGAVEDMPAAYAAATVVVAAAVQPEGVQRAVLEAQAMARPVVVSDLAAGPEAVLAPPAVPEERMTGLRVATDDEAALATGLIRLFSLTDAARAAVGARGRAWVSDHFNAPGVARETLALYAEIARRPR